MLPYYCNEAMLLLPKVASMVDSSRHALSIVTEDGAKVDLVIARVRAEKDESLRAVIESGIQDQARSRRGFQLLSKEDATYAGWDGIQVRSRFIDKLRGPVFHHVFHTRVDLDRVGFFAISSIEEAAACDAWMATMLANLTPRT